jgi:magnesium-transporting ATPase (P-type)
MTIFGILLAVSMLVVYYITFSGIYDVFPGNYSFGALNSEYLFTSVTGTFGVGKKEAKTLTMLMVTLFFCESFLIFQIRRPNKSLIKSIREDSTKRMYLIIGFLFAVFLMLMYIPGVQVTLADAGINLMFMYLTGLDWLVCFLISLICVVSFEIVKYAARRYGITF